MEKPLPWQKRILNALWTTFLFGVTALLWAASYALFVDYSSSSSFAGLELDNLFTALFGASSIALVILSFLITSLGLLGWQSIKKHIDRRVQEAIKSRTQILENELRGRVATVLGYAIGEMSLAPGSFIASDKGRLEEAVHQCSEGYKYLQKAGNEAAEMLGLNNLAFYTCIYETGVVPKKNAPKMLQIAQQLRTAGEKHDSVMLQLTACRVLLEYKAEKAERKKAIEVLRTVVTRPSASERERAEAQFYLDIYDKPEESELNSSEPHPSENIETSLFKKWLRRLFDA